MTPEEIAQEIAASWVARDNHLFWVCPRCFAAVPNMPATRDGHIDWHTGVRDGFHDFVPGSPRFSSRMTEKQCAAEMRNSAGGAFWYCGLPSDHWYHQPLPTVDPA